MKNLIKWCCVLCCFITPAVLTKALAAQNYNDVQQKSSHNSFGRHEGFLDQFLFHRIRSVELDIYRSKIGQSYDDDNWFVYHTPVVDTRTNCNRLSDCLALFRIFDQQVPQHEVVTVWVDAREGFYGSQNEAAFDKLITRYINKNDILKPSDLHQACPSAGSLKDTVSNGCDWPSLSALKGKWIFVITSGDYETDRDNRIAFRAESIASTRDIDRSRRIFFNTSSKNNTLTNHIHRDNFVSRRYVLDSRGDFESAISGKTHHISTNKINFLNDNWAKTHNANDLTAWPFRCIGNCGTQHEKGNTIGIEVNSEDIWGRRDHFTFLYQDRNRSHSRYEASIHAASSHVDRWAKGCLMVRASLSNNSPYLAICRPSDNSTLRVQWREDYSNNSRFAEKAINLSVAPGVERADLSFVKIDTWRENHCAIASGSVDGKNWTNIASQCFSEPLRYQGLAASSHGNRNVRHLFNNVTLWGDTQKASDFSRRNIGTVRHVKVADQRR